MKNNTDHFLEKLKKVEQDIQHFGLSVVTVSEGRDRQRFAYSVGLETTYDHPEIVISGLPADVAATLINDCAALVKAGRQFTDHSLVEGLLNGSYKCEFRELTNKGKEDVFGLAFAHYGDADFGALQLIWPDRQGHLPDDLEYKQGVDLQDFFFA